MFNLPPIMAVRDAYWRRRSVMWTAAKTGGVIYEAVLLHQKSGWTPVLLFFGEGKSEGERLLGFLWRTYSYPRKELYSPKIGCVSTNSKLQSILLKYIRFIK